MSKVKILLDVVNEVKKEAPEDGPNWNSKLAEAKVNLQNQIAKGRLLPRGVEDHPLEHFAFNYSVQRDVRAGHVMNIMHLIPTNNSVMTIGSDKKINDTCTFNAKLRQV